MVFSMANKKSEKYNYISGIPLNFLTKRGGELKPQHSLWMLSMGNNNVFFLYFLVEVGNADSDFSLSNLSGVVSEC